MLECKAIEYTFDIENSHNLNIEGFKLSINYFLIALATEIAVSQPAEMQSLFKKKREKKRWWGVKGKKINTKVLIKGTINKPEISLINEETGNSLITIGGIGWFEVIEQNLKYDIYHKDLKRTANFFMQSIECFIDDQEDNFFQKAEFPKICEFKDIKLNMTYFSYQFCYVNYAYNCAAADENLWHKEKRINKIEIELPEILANIESEEFATFIDVIKGFVGFIPKDKVSMSEILMQDEFKIHGGKELVKKFMENMKNKSLPRAKESQVLKIYLQKISLCLQKNSATFIELVLSGIKGQITTFTDISCQKSLEIHNIQMAHGKTIMISPLLTGSEEYLPSNTMLSLRLLDR